MFEEILVYLNLELQSRYFPRYYLSFEFKPVVTTKWILKCHVIAESIWLKWRYVIDLVHIKDSVLSQLTQNKTDFFGTSLKIKKSRSKNALTALLNQKTSTTSKTINVLLLHNVELTKQSQLKYPVSIMAEESYLCSKVLNLCLFPCLF